MGLYLGMGDGRDGYFPTSGQINSYGQISSLSSAGQKRVYTPLSVNRGDFVLLVGNYGSEAGQAELVPVDSPGSGYFDSFLNLGSSYNANNAQAVKVPQFSSGIITGTITAPAFDGLVGGVLAYVVKGYLENQGWLNTDAIGYRGGSYGSSPNSPSQQGESKNGLGGSSNSRNLDGGGGGNKESGPGGNDYGAGGGGAHMTNGGDGTNAGGQTNGQGGLASAIPYLFGAGAGQGGGDFIGNFKSNGGRGAGMHFGWAYHFKNKNKISSNGEDGYFSRGGGGGGAGGMNRLQAFILDLVFGTPTALGGIGQNNYSRGGKGGDGGVGYNEMLACILTGTMNPTPTNNSSTLNYCSYNGSMV